MRRIIDHEYHPPSQEHPKSQEFAPLGDEYNADAADPPRRVRKRHWAAHAVAAVITVALLSSAVASSGSGSGPSADGTFPPVVSQPPAAAVSQPPAAAPAHTAEPGQPLLTLAEAVERYPNWYDESHGVWLHFEGNEGWFSDGQFFHRFIWQATGDYSGISTMSFHDIGGGYTLSGSAAEPGEYPMTLLDDHGVCRLETASGMGEGIIGSSVFYEAPELTVNSFVPVEELGADGSGMEGVLGKTTEELLIGITHFTVSEQVSAPFGSVGLNTSLSAGMTDLYFDPGGSGSLFYDDGTAALIEWSVNGDYAGSVQFSYENVAFSDGAEYTYNAYGELTLTADGPRLWFYNSFANAETCFAPK